MSDRGEEAGRLVQVYVCCGSLCQLVCCNLLWYSFSVLYSHYMEQFDCDVAQMSWLISSLTLVMSVGMILSSSFIDYYGCRRVSLFCTAGTGVIFSLTYLAPGLYYLCACYLLAGALASLSVSCAFVYSQLCLNKHRAVGTVFVSAGYGVCSMVSPVLTRWLLDTYGWRGTCLLIGGVTLQGLVFASLQSEHNVASHLKVRRPKHPFSVDVLRNMFHLELLKHPPFTLSLMTSLLASSIVYMYGAHVTNYLMAIGQSRTHAAYLQSLGYLGDVICRPVLSLLLSVGVITPLCTQLVVMTTAAVLLFVLGSLTLQGASLLITLVAFGITNGGIAGMMWSVPAHLADPQRVSHSFSLLSVFMTIGGSGGPVVVGNLVHVTQWYPDAMLFGGACATAGLLTSLATILTHKVSRYRSKKALSVS